MHDRAGFQALAALVRARRRTLGPTQADVADLAEVSPRFVHSLEAGKGTVRVDKLLAVFDVLGVSLTAGAADVQVRV